MSGVASGPSLDEVAVRHPEWRGWLGLYRAVRPALDDPAWDAVVPPLTAGSPGTPLLAGAVFSLDARMAQRLVNPVLDRARSAAGEPGMARLGADESRRLLEAALDADDAALVAFAADRGLRPALLAEVAALVVMPILQACRRAWAARVRPDALDAACPVCGAWATLTEARGVERTLRQRCGRCGADWAAQPVRCPFCGNVDHTTLGALVSEGMGDLRRAETCTVCLAYVKTVAMLQPCPPADVRLLDLETVDLDVAALEHGYARPSRPAHRLGVRVVATPGGRLGGLFRR